MVVFIVGIVLCLSVCQVVSVCPLLQTEFPLEGQIKSESESESEGGNIIKLKVKWEEVEGVEMEAGE